MARVLRLGLCEILLTYKYNIYKESCWCLENILANGSPADIIAVDVGVSNEHFAASASIIIILATTTNMIYLLNTEILPFGYDIILINSDIREIVIQ